MPNNSLSSPGRADLPLFYRNPVPLDARQHDNLSLRQDFGYSFTQSVNAVPVNLVELPQIQHYYPICFSPDGNATPVAILGLRDEENLFVDEHGNWLEGFYIPAYIRRYPFIFAELPGGEQLTLCVDSGSNKLVDGRFNPFFDLDGNPSKLSQSALEFCKSYHAAAQQTLGFSRALAQLDLLAERSAVIQLTNATINFSGFTIIDEEKLAALSNEVFLQLRQQGLLPFIYAHLFSGNQWGRMRDLLVARFTKGEETQREAPIGGVEPIASTETKEVVPSEDRIFADRLAAKAHFQDCLDIARTGRLKIATYWGIHNVGKTRFFRELRALYGTRQEDIHLAHFQFPQDRSPTILDVFHGLTSNLVRIYEVKVRRYTYGRELLIAARQISAQQADPTRTQKQLMLERSGGAAEAAVGAVPFGSIINYTVRGALDLMRSFRDHQSGYREEVRQALHDSNGDLLEPNEIERRLPQLLAVDLNELYSASKDPLLVLLLDEYERIWPSADSVPEDTSLPVDTAIRDLVAGLDRGVVALFTREIPAWDQDPRILSHLDNSWAYALGPFSSEDSRNFLGRYVNETDVIDVMVRVARGNPGLLNLQLDQYREIRHSQQRRPVPEDFLVDGETPEGIGRAIAFNMLRDHRQEYRQLFEILAAFRSFDRSLFEVAVRSFNVPVALNEFQRITQLSFIETAEKGAGNHRIRDLVRDLLKQRSSPEDLQKIHQLAVEHFQQQMLQEQRESRYDAVLRSALEGFFYRYCLAPWPAVEWICTQIAELGRDLQHTYAIELAQQALIEMNRFDGSPEQQLTLELALTQSLHSAGLIARAQRQAQTTFQHSQESKDLYLHCRAASLLLRCLVSAGSLVEAELSLRPLEHTVESLERSEEWAPEQIQPFRQELDIAAIDLYLAQGRYSLAETLVRSWLTRQEVDLKALKSSSLPIYWLRKGGTLHLQRSNLEEAGRRYQEATEMAAQQPETRAWERFCWLDQAILALELRDPQAAAHAIQMCRQSGSSIPEDSPIQAYLDGREGMLLMLLNRFQEAESLLAQARRTLSHRFGYGDSFITRLIQCQAESLLNLGRLTSAIALLRQELRRLEEQQGDGHPGLTLLLPALIRALELAMDDKEVLVDVDKAAEALRELGTRSQRNLQLLQRDNQLHLPTANEVEPEAVPSDLLQRLAASIATRSLDRLELKHLRLDFYPEALLIRIGFPGEAPCELYAFDLGDAIHFIDGAPINLESLNRHVLRLNDETVADYVRFFLELNRRAHSFPQLLESIDNLPPELNFDAESRHELDQEIFGLRLLRGGTESWLLRGCILAAEKIEATDIRVLMDGSVSFSNSHPLSNSLPSRHHQPSIPEALESLFLSDLSGLFQSSPPSEKGTKPHPIPLLPGKWETVSADSASSIIAEILSNNRELEDQLLADGECLLSLDQLPLSSVNGNLYQLTLSFEASVAAIDWVTLPDQHFVLDGTNQPLFALWRAIQNGYKVQEAADQYVRLFTSAVRGEESRFHVLEGPEQLKWMKQPSIEVETLNIPRWQSFRDKNERIFYSGTILYGNTLFKVRLTLDTENGLVSMLDEDPIIVDLPLLQEFYRGPLRVLGQESKNRK